MLAKALYATVATTAFGILFNVQKKNLILTGINGGIGYLVYLLTLNQGFESYIGMLFASLLMSIIAEITARVRKTPASIFLAAALIPIVPGGGMFSCALHLLEGNNGLAIEAGIKTLLESGAIAIGIIVVSSFTKMIIHRIQRKRIYEI